jgi:hypothetical protein
VTREFRIEERAVAEMEKLGCLCPKWGTDGWPDRIVMLPGGGVVWMEFKKPKKEGGRLEIVQKVRHHQVKKIGHKIHVVVSVTQAIALVTDALRLIPGSEGGGGGAAAPAEVLPLGQARVGQDGGGADGG